MAISLAKGQGITLHASEFDLSTISLELDWERDVPGHLLKRLFGSAPEAFKLDAVALLCHADGKVHRLGENLAGGDVVFFNHRRHSSGAIWLGDDDSVADAGSHEDARIIMRPAVMPAEVARIMIVASIFQGQRRKQHLGQLHRIVMRVLDAQEREIAHMEVRAGPETQDMCSMVLAELGRTGDGWAFRALLQPESTDNFVMILRDYYMPPFGLN